MNAARDDNAASTLIGVSSADGVTPICARTDPVTGYVLATIVKTAYAATPIAPKIDDNAVGVQLGVTNNAAQTPKSLLSDPNHTGYVLADISLL